MATRGQKLVGGNVINGQGTGGGSQTGSNWTNLSQYLDANKGAGAGMADGITQDTQKEVERIDNQGGAVDTWETDSKKNVDSNTRQDTYSGTIKNGSSQQVADINKQDYSAWKGLGNYYGAGDASQTQGYDQVYKDVNNTKDQIKNLNSYEGQKVALKNTYGKQGNYGQGFQALDTFALNGDQSGQQKLQDFQTKNANFGQKFDASTAGINSYIGGAEQRGKTVLDNTNKAITDRSKGYSSAAQAAADKDDGGYATQVQAVKDKYAQSGVAAPETVSGFSGRGIDLSSQYVDQTKGDASAYMEDVDLAALNSLSGIDEDVDTKAQTKGNKASASVNWDALMSDINAKTPKQAVPTAEQMPTLSSDPTLDDLGDDIDPITGLPRKPI